MTTVTTLAEVEKRNANDAALTSLIAKIKTDWANLQAVEKSTKEARLAFGRLLLDAKDKVGKGKFGEWIEKNCSITWRTANRYMAVVRLDKLSNSTGSGSAKGSAPKQSQPPSASDVYDKAEDRLVEKLQALSLAEAEAAAEQTVKKLRATINTMKQVLKNAA
jgi:hypothetical protein